MVRRDFSKLESARQDGAFWTGAMLVLVTLLLGVAPGVAGTHSSDDLALAGFNGGTSTWVNPTNVQASDDAYSTQANNGRNFRLVLDDVDPAFVGNTPPTEVYSVRVLLEQSITDFVDDGFTLRAYLGPGTNLVAGPQLVTGTATDTTIIWDITAARAWTLSDLDDLEIKVTSTAAGDKDGTWNIDFLGVNVGLNRPPTVEAKSLNVDEDASVMGTLSGEDQDGDLLTFRVRTNPSNGAITAFDSSTGEFTYQPDADFFGTDSFTYDAIDGVDEGSLDAADATVTITVANTPDPPTLGDDLFEVDEDSVDNELDVLANDDDAPDEGETLTIIDVYAIDADPLTISIEGGGTIIHYTPKANFAGQEIFGYTVSDGTSTADAIITVSVENLPDAPVLDPLADDSADEDVPYQRTISAEDIEDELEELIFRVTQGPGWLSFAGNVLQGTPGNDDVGTFTVSIEVEDTSGLTDSAEFMLTIVNINDAPTAASTSLETNEDVTLTGSLEGLVNDVDAGDSLTYHVVDSGAGGTFTIADATVGEFSYAPDLDTNFVVFGMESVDYMVCDDEGACATNSIEIMIHPVNDAPSFTPGGDDFLEEDAGFQELVGWATDISAGPQEEPSLQSVSFEVWADDPAKFSQQPLLSPDGTLTYETAPNVAGPLTVSIEMHDTGGTDRGGDNTADIIMFTIHVEQVQELPVGQDDSYTTDEDVTLTVSAEDGVLANDDDPDGDTLTAALVDDVSNGALTFNPDGSFEYVPGPHFFGSDSFTYTIDDGTPWHDPQGPYTASISIESVNDAPVLDPIGNQMATEDEFFSTSLSATDVEDGTVGTFSMESGPAWLGVSGSTLSGTPGDDDNGDFLVTVRATDSDGAFDEETFTVSVEGTPDAPVLATIPPLVATEDAAFYFDVEADDADPDAVLTFSVEGAPAWLSIHSATGELTGTPSNDDVTDGGSFTVKVTDGTLEDSQVVSFSVENTNDPPIADAGADDAVDEDDTVQLDGSGSHDVDVGDTITYSWVQTSGVTVALDDASLVNPSFTAPETGAAASVTLVFELTVSDGQAVDTDSVEIAVGEINDAPVANAGSDQLVQEDEPVTLDGSASMDVDDDSLTYSWVQTAGTTVSLDDASLVTPKFSAPETFAAASISLEFDLTVTDEHGLQHTDSVEVVVQERNDAPVANAGTDTTATEDDLVTLFGSGSDVDGDSLTFSWSQVSGPIVVLSDASAEEPSFAAPETAAAASITLEFALTVTDEHGLQHTDSVEVVVLERNDAPVADAGDDQEVTEDDLVTLLGSGSDVDGDSLTFSWSQTSGQGVTVSDASAAQPSFTAPETGAAASVTLEFALTVTDEHGLQHTDSVEITVLERNDAPVANAGTDTTATEDDLVTLFGSGSDVDGDSLTYAWSQASGPGVTLSGETTTEPSFTAPETGAAASVTLEFVLTVTDEHGLQHTDSVEITVLERNDAPVADAGPNQLVQEDDQVTLDGSASMDVDDDSLTYSWVQTAGTTVSLDDASLVTPKFSAPETFAAASISLEFDLTVTDEHGLQHTDSVEIVVQERNDAPVANAGTDTTATEDDPVTLFGSGSDVDGDSLTFSWSQASGPVVTLSGENTAQPSFTAPETAAAASITLEFALTVTDEHGLQHTDSVEVVVLERNDAPVANAGTDTTATEDDLVTLFGSGSDVDGDTIGFSWSQTSGLSVTLSDAAVAQPTFTAPETAAAASITLEFALTVTDEHGLVDTDSVEIVVVERNDAPTTGNVLTSGPEDAALPFPVVGSDVDGDSLSFNLAAPPSHGHILLYSDGSGVYLPDSNWHGTESIEILVSDGQASATATVEFTILADATPAFPGGMNTPSNAYHGDDDGDGYPNAIEWMYGSDANRADSDPNQVSNPVVNPGFELGLAGWLVLEDGPVEGTVPAPHKASVSYFSTPGGIGTPSPQLGVPDECTPIDFMGTPLPVPDSTVILEPACTAAYLAALTNTDDAPPSNPGYNSGGAAVLQQDPDPANHNDGLRLVQAFGDDTVPSGITGGVSFVIEVKDYAGNAGSKPLVSICYGAADCSNGLGADDVELSLGLNRIPLVGAEGAELYHISIYPPIGDNYPGSYVVVDNVRIEGATGGLAVPAAPALVDGPSDNLAIQLGEPVDGTIPVTLLREDSPGVADELNDLTDFDCALFNAERAVEFTGTSGTVAAAAPAGYHLEAHCWDGTEWLSGHVLVGAPASEPVDPVPQEADAILDFIDACENAGAACPDSLVVVEGMPGEGILTITLAGSAIGLDDVVFEVDQETCTVTTDVGDGPVVVDQLATVCSTSIPSIEPEVGGTALDDPEGPALFIALSSDGEEVVRVEAVREDTPMVFRIWFMGMPVTGV